MQITNEQIWMAVYSIIIGLILGVEREIKNKPAGLRTMVLVCLGSCIFTMVSVAIGGPSETDRIASNIVTGIGFLGAGAIFKDDSKVNGLTTAAIIWVCAALGMSVGTGEVFFPITIAFAIVILLLLLNYIEDKILELNIRTEYKISLANENRKKIDQVYNMFHNVKVRYKLLHLEKTENRVWYSFSIKASQKKHSELKSLLVNDADIIGYRF